MVQALAEAKRLRDTYGLLAYVARSRRWDGGWTRWQVHV